MRYSGGIIMVYMNTTRYICLITQKIHIMAQKYDNICTSDDTKEGTRDDRIVMEMM